MPKTHYKVTRVDCRQQGETEYEFSHQTACGYVRDNVSSNGDEVDCKLCLNSIHLVHYHTINKTLTDSQGAIDEKRYNAETKTPERSGGRF